MGDSRITISLRGKLHEQQQQQLLKSENNDRKKDKSSSGSSSSNVVVLPADSALRELLDYILTNLYPQLCPPSSSSVVVTTEEQLLPPSIEVYNLTYHPPTNITSTIHSHNEYKGSKSKTLQSMGWFPSGKIALVLKEDKEGIKDILEGCGKVHLEDDEFQYNLPEHLLKKKRVEEEGSTEDCKGSNGTATKVVRLKEEWGGSNDATTNQELKPSDVFAAVKNRFENDNDNNDQHKHLKLSKIQRKKRTEQERCKQIDARLALLEQTSSTKKNKKNKKVSNQVRKMLIKSRAQGDNKKLKEEDKFYLETMVLYDDDVLKGEKEEEEEDVCSYRFFSKMNTAGKVASSILLKSGGKVWEKKKEECTMELLVKRPTKQQEQQQQQEKEEANSSFFVYRRLPNTMMLYEAEAGGYITQFDRVVVRVYRLNHVMGKQQSGNEESVDDLSGPSRSVLDDDAGDEEEDNGNCSNEPKKGEETDVVKLQNEEREVATAATAENDNTNQNNKIKQIYNRIDTAIQHMEENDGTNKKTKKKASKTSDKVRQMLMKSRAKGDKKSIKENDRFYMELVFIVDDVDEQSSAETTTASSTYVFVSKKRCTIAQILELTAIQEKQDVGKELEVLVKNKQQQKGDDGTNSYSRLPNSLTLSEAEEKGYAANFDCMIVRQFPKEGGMTLPLIQ